MPWICAICTCQIGHRSIQSLGGHWNSGHRNTLLNDNGDGTFSVLPNPHSSDVDQYRAWRVISNRSSPDYLASLAPCVEPTESTRHTRGKNKRNAGSSQEDSQASKKTKIE